MWSHPQWDVSAALFLVLIHRNITLNGSLGFSLGGTNKNTEAIDYDRHIFSSDKVL